MPFTHKTYNTARSLFCEKRLCHQTDSPDHIQESFGAKEQIAANPPLRDAITEYQTAFNTIKKVNEEKRAVSSTLLTESDRENFMSLVVNGMMPKTAKLDYKNVAKKDINATDPVDLFALNDEGMVRWLINLYEQSDANTKVGLELKLNALAGGTIFGVARDDSTDVQKVTALGAAYKQRLFDLKNAWLKHPNSNPVAAESAQLVVVHYLNNKTKLEAMLQAKRIVSPAEKENVIDVQRGNLTKSEYRGLLLLMWQGKEADVQMMVDRGLDGIRRGLGVTHKAQTARVDSIANDLSVGPQNPGETLNRFGVMIGPIVLRDYMLMRTGALVGKTNTPSDSAATWIDHPDRAYEFLLSRLVATPANAEFLRSLRYHLVLTDAERKSEVPSAMPKMSADDTKITLSLLVQQLMRRENIIETSSRDREVMRKDEGWDGKIEKHVAGAWDYIKNVSEHPVGSVALGIIGFLAVRSIWKMMFGGGGAHGHGHDGEHKKEGGGFWKGVGLLALGAVGVNMYMKHTTGTSPVDQLGQWMKSPEKFDPAIRLGKEIPGLKNVTTTFEEWWKANQDKKEPGKATLISYWHEQLQVGATDDLREPDAEKTLALLQDRRVDEVLPWYERMDLAMRDPSKERPDFPFSIRNKKKFFGDMKQSQISEVFYFTMKRFFANRGKSLARDPMFKGKGAVAGDAERGLAYIRMRYMNIKEYKVLMENTLKITKIEVNGKECDLSKIPITEKDFTTPSHPDLIALKKLLKPDDYAKVLLGALMYKQMTAEDKTHQWTMSQVFLSEADPELLGTVDPEGANALTGLYTLAKEVKKPLVASGSAPLLAPILTPQKMSVTTPVQLKTGKPFQFIASAAIELRSQEPIQIKIGDAVHAVQPNVPVPIPVNTPIFIPEGAPVTLRAMDETVPAELAFTKIP